MLRTFLIKKIFLALTLIRNLNRQGRNRLRYPGYIFPGGTDKNKENPCLFWLVSPPSLESGASRMQVTAVTA
jgi:hypothetical protein